MICLSGISMKRLVKINLSTYLMSILKRSSRQLLSEIFLTQHISEAKYHQKSNKEQNKFE